MPGSHDFPTLCAAQTSMPTPWRCETRLPPSKIKSGTSRCGAERVQGGSVCRNCCLGLQRQDSFHLSAQGLSDWDDLLDTPTGEEILRGCHLY